MTLAQGESDVPLVEPIAADNAGATLVDEGFLRDTAKELQESAGPTTGLRHEEKARLRRITPMIALMSLVAAGSLPFFGGTLWAKTLFACTLSAGTIAMLWLWWLARQPAPLKSWQLSLAWMIAFSATCANTIYFGIFSPAPIMMALAVMISAQGHSRVLARAVYLLAALTQGSVALLDALGFVPDPGLIQGDRLTGVEKVAGHLLMQSMLITTHLLGRFARHSSAEAIAMTQQAMRELARREVLAKEARDDVRRAFNIGGSGRLSGRIFGSYKLSEVIGHGGMGEVYKANHLTLESEAAVKVIHPHLCQNKELVQRFLREARLSASLDSPYIVRVLDAGLQQVDGPYIAMELLPGHDLATHLQAVGLLSLPQLLQVAEQVGAGLDAAAGSQIVHRDIKPQNLFLMSADPHQDTKTLRCKILDFGVARVMSGQATLTKANAVLGTPSYMSPEQATGGTTDRRCDLHALVAVLYRACTGFVPFDGENGQAILYSVVHSTPVPVSKRANLPHQLDAFFSKGFAKDPSQRFQSGRELYQALREACSGSLVASGAQN